MYYRKSITVLQVVPIDNQTKNLPNEYITLINNNIRRAVTSVSLGVDGEEYATASRLDFNLLSDSIQEIYKKEVIKNTIESSSDATESIMKSIVKETVLPQILSYIETEMETRARRILSEQQQNSFITDKARETGITDYEITSVLDSSYILAPLIWGYKEDRDAEGNPRVQISIGAYLFRINSAENTLLVDSAIIKEDIIGIGQQYDRRMQELTGRILSWEERRTNARQSAINRASYNFFSFRNDRLTSQILRTTPSRVFFQMDKVSSKEISTNYQFAFIETVERDGQITSREKGWAIVRKITEKDSETLLIEAQTISGLPYIGQEVKSLHSKRWSASYGIRNIPFYIEKNNDSQTGTLQNLDAQNGFGVYFEGQNKTNVFQLFNVVRLQFFWGDAKGNVFYEENDFEIKRLWGFQTDYGLRKNFLIRRVVIGPEITAGIHNIAFRTGKIDNKDISASSFSAGGTALLNLEYTISHARSVGIFGGYQLFADRNKWRGKLFSIEETAKKFDIKDNDKILHRGLTFGVYTTF